MKKIQLSCSVQTQNGLPCIVVNTQNLPQNIKICETQLKLVAISEASSVRIDFYNNQNALWENVDTIAPQEYAQILHIENELQYALDNKMQSATFVFVTENAQNVSLEVESATAEYIFVSEYQENGVNHNLSIGSAGEASVSLSTGEVSLVHVDAATNSSTMPVSVSHIYSDSQPQSMPSGDDFASRYGNSFRLNLEQYLVREDNVEKEDRFTYIDQNGKEHALSEKYYIIKDGAKVYVDRNKLTQNINGELEYDGEKVKTICTAPEGLKLVTSKKDIVGAHLVDSDPEELTQVTEQLDALEMSKEQIEFSLDQSKKQLCLLALSSEAYKKQLALQLEEIEQTQYTNDLRTKAEKLSALYKILYDREKANSLNEYIRNRYPNKQDFNDAYKHLMYEYNNKYPDRGEYDKFESLMWTKETFKDFSKLLINESGSIFALGYDFFGDEVDPNGDKQSGSGLGGDTECGSNPGYNDPYEIIEKNDDYKGSLYLQIKSNDLNKELYKEEITQEKFAEILTNNIDDLYENKEELKALYNSLKTSVTEKDESGKSVTTEKVLYSAKDYFSLVMQIESCVQSIKDSEKQLADYNKKIEKYSAIKEQYEQQLPLYYLQKDNIILGFAATSKPNVSRLVCMFDSYENVANINYDGYTNKIKSVVDGSGNEITFVYSSDGMLEKLVNYNGKETRFSYMDGCLSQITYSNGDFSQYCYDTYGKLYRVISPELAGVEFARSGDSVKVTTLSGIEKIEDGKVLADENFKIDATSLESFAVEVLDIERNSTRSTFVKTTDINGNVHQATYIFDITGKVRAVYEDELRTDGLPTRVKSFDYKSQKIGEDLGCVDCRQTLSVENMTNSTNYLDGVCFNSEVLVPTAANYLGNSLDAGEESLCEEYLVHSGYHQVQNGKESVAVSQENISKINQNKPQTLILGGWAKADSAYIAENSVRKFTISATVSYTDGSTSTSYTNFDWTNTGWQYAAAVVSVDKSKTILGINCEFDYTANTGAAYFTDMTLCEAWYTQELYDQNLLTRHESNKERFVTECTYNADDQLVSRKIKSRETGEEIGEDKFYYNAAGKVYESIDHQGIVTKTEYNDKGEVAKTISYHESAPAEMLVQETSLDEKGREKETLNDFGEIVSENVYNANGELESTRDTNGTAFASNVSEDGNVSQLSVEIDGEANSTTIKHDKGYLVNASHNGFGIDYNYDKFGRVSEIKVAGKRHTTVEYQPNKTTTTLGDYSATAETDKDGNVWRVSEGKNVVINNRYDTVGNLVHAEDNLAGEATEYYYDTYGNVVRQTKSGTKGYEKNNEYKDDLLSAQSYTIGDKTLETNYIYDKLGEVSEVVLSNDVTQVLSKDGLGRVKEVNADGALHVYNYLTRGGKTSNLVASEWFGTSDMLKDNYKYGYDAKGNLTSVRFNGELVARYSYDALNRLTREDNKQFNKTCTYSYDAGGNITERREYAFTTKDEQPQECIKFSYSYPIHGWRDQLAEYNGKAFTYDSVGNPVVYKDKAMTWTRGRMLSSYNGAMFSYNASGVRTQKVANGVTTDYILDGTKVLMQDNGNKMYFHYGVNGVQGFTYNNQEYAYQKNIFGDIIAIIDSNNQKIAKYAYDAWGNCKTYVLNDGTFVDIQSVLNYTQDGLNSKAVANANPFRYRGYYYDTETNLYYLNTRYYDPEIGRFVNVDDLSVLDKTQNVINGLNLYAYCLNNPIMDTDENGSLPKWLRWLIGGLAVVAAVAISVLTFGSATPILVGAAIGTVVGAGVEAGRQLITNGKITDWGAIGLSALGGLVSGAVAAIPIGGTGVLSYVGTFFAGALGTVAGGVVTGSVKDAKTATLAFTVGGVANVAGRGLSDLIALGKTSQIFNQSNKAKSLSIQKLAGSEFNAGKSVLKGSMRNAFKNMTKQEIFKLVSNASTLFRNGIYSSIFSSVIGGWY